MRGRAENGGAAGAGLSRTELWAMLAALLAGGLLTLLFLNSPNFAIALAALLAVGTVLALRPKLYIAVYIILMLSAPAVLRGVSAFQIGLRPDQALLLLGLVAMLAVVLIRRWPMPVNPPLMVYGVYLAMFTVSTLYSKFALGYQFNATDAIQIAGLGRGMAILFVFMLLISSTARAMTVVNVTLVMGAFDILFGYAQQLNVPFVRAATLALFNRKYELEDWQLFSRVTSIFDGQSNQAGMFAYIFGGLLLGIVLCVGRKRPTLTAVALALLVLDIGFLFFTASRGALLATFVAVLVVAFVIGRRWIVALVIAGMVAATMAAFTFAPVLIERVSDLVATVTNTAEVEEIGISGRMRYWQESLNDFFWHTPVLGSGANYVQADSAYIAELANRGIVGLVLYIFMLLLAARTAYLTWRHCRDPIGRALGICIMFSVAGLFVQGITIPVLSGSRPAELFWLLYAAMWFYYPFQHRIELSQSKEAQ